MLYEGVSARPTTIPLAKVRALAVSQCRLRVNRVILVVGRLLPLCSQQRRGGRHVSKVPTASSHLMFLFVRIEAPEQGVSVHRGDRSRRTKAFWRSLE
jgi:hypothetical protein